MILLLLMCFDIFPYFLNPTKLFVNSSLRNFIFEKEFQIRIPWKSFSSFELKIEKKMMKKFNKKPLFLRKEKWYKKGGKSLKKNTWTAKKKRFKFKLRLKWIHFFVDFTKRSFQVLKLISVCFSSPTEKRL